MAADGDPEEGGLFTKGSEGNFLTQIGVAAPQWAITGAWRYGQCGQNFRRGTQFARQTQACGGSDKSGYSNNFAVTAAWQPKESRWIPSINLGWGYNDLNQGLDINDLQDLGINPYYYRENISASQSWAVALQWQDTFIEGNAMGMAVGQPVFATKLEDGSTPNDGNYVWEWWYRFQVTDNISVTPGSLLPEPPRWPVHHSRGRQHRLRRSGADPIQILILWFRTLLAVTSTPALPPFPPAPGRGIFLCLPASTAPAVREIMGCLFPDRPATPPCRRPPAIPTPSSDGWPARRTPTTCWEYPPGPARRRSRRPTGRW